MQYYRLQEIFSLTLYVIKATNGIIQSAFYKPYKEKMKQGQASLDSIVDYFKKIIITQDRTKLWWNEKGYVVMNILDFLLNRNSLEV